MGAFVPTNERRLLLCSRSHSLSDLCQVVLQVDYIVLDQKLQRHRLIVTDDARGVRCFERSVLYDVRQGLVVATPKLIQGAQRDTVVASASDPLVLLILRKHELVH